MKYIITCLMLLISTFMVAQTPMPTVFDSTTYSFGLTPVTLPRSGTTLTGAETDMMVHFTPNNVFGQTTIISTAPFIGGRYDRVFPSIGQYLQNHTSLTGGHFQGYLTASLGVVKAANLHYGERVGFGLKYAPNGSDNFDVAFEVQANNLPGIAHWIPSVSVSPQFRF